MIVILNSPGFILKCTCFILKKLKIDIFVLGTPKAPHLLNFQSVTYSKKDNIGFVNYPGSQAIEVFLNDALIQQVISHFAQFFTSVTNVEEKLEHIFSSKINFFKAAQLNFFLVNEIERSDERVVVLDSKFHHSSQSRLVFTIKISSTFICPFLTFAMRYICF